MSGSRDDFSKTLHYIFCTAWCKTGSDISIIVPSTAPGWVHQSAANIAMAKASINLTPVTYPTLYQAVSSFFNPFKTESHVCHIWAEVSQVSPLG